MVNGTVTERFIYQNQLKPAAKVDASGNILEQYIYGTRINTPDYIIKNNEQYRVISDERGSVRLVVKVTDGTVAQRVDYNEFGIVIADSNPGFQPFYYAGGVYDLDTQLVKFGARDYDPVTGRWLQKEPLGFNGSDNFYVYSNNNPINLIDINGFAPGDPFNSPEEAARDAAQYTWDNYSESRFVEYAAEIYKEGDTWRYREPYTDNYVDQVFIKHNPAPLSPSDPPSRKIDALWHNHVAWRDSSIWRRSYWRKSMVCEFDGQPELSDNDKKLPWRTFVTLFDTMGDRPVMMHGPELR